MSVATGQLRVEQIMGTAIGIDLRDAFVPAAAMDDAFASLRRADAQFSTFRPDSEVSRLGRGELTLAGCSLELRQVLTLAEQLRIDSRGHFDVRRHRADGGLDPSGIVKGWAIRNAAAIIAESGARDFYVEAGGDIQSAGMNAAGKPWSVGIRNPFNAEEIIKVVYPRGQGIATSGTYVRGQHIYDPHQPGRPIEDIVSLTVIGPDVLEADRFATAAFAMGRAGILFIEETPGLEGYLVDQTGRATLTSGLEAYCTP
jgi:FAD:protein FMN transferase